MLYIMRNCYQDGIAPMVWGMSFTLSIKVQILVCAIFMGNCSASGDRARAFLEPDPVICAPFPPARKLIGSTPCRGGPSGRANLPMMKMRKIRNYYEEVIFIGLSLYFIDNSS